MKCQNCRAVLPQNTRICEYCDTKVTIPESRHGEFLKNLENKLTEVDESLLVPKETKDGKKILDTATLGMQQLQSMDKARKKKVLIIQNFSIPNNRNDLYDLLIHASTTSKSLRSGVDKIVNKSMANAWDAKASQAYHKLLVIAEEDEKLKKRLKPFERSYGLGHDVSFGFGDTNLKSKWKVFFICWFLGWSGAHRFYVGKTGTGFLMLFTFGCFYILWIIDLITILSGNFKDKQGRLLQ